MNRNPFRLAATVASAAVMALATALPAAAAPTGPAATELDAVVAGLNQLSGSVPASVTGWHADPATGSVVVSVLGSDPAAAAWAAGTGAGVVRIEKVTEAPRPLWEIRGGQPLYPPGGGRCTVGFNARSATGTRVVITAGHCVVLGGIHHGVGGPIGPGVAKVFPGSMDAGLIQVTYSDAMSTPYVGRYLIRGSNQAPVGATVCKLGSTSGLTCGTLLARGATVCYPQGCVTGLNRASFCSEPGDSGAPVFTPGPPSQAQGVVSGGSGNCTTGGTTYYTPIQAVLNMWGLTLYTG